MPNYVGGNCCDEKFYMGTDDWGDVFLADSISTTTSASLSSASATSTASLMAATTTTSVAASSTPLSTPSKESDIGMTVGLAVGVPLGVLVAGLLALLFWREMRKGKRRARSETGPGSGTDGRPVEAGGGMRGIPTSSAYKDQVPQHFPAPYPSSHPHAQPSNAWSPARPETTPLRPELSDEQQVSELQYHGDDARELDGNPKLGR